MKKLKFYTLLAFFLLSVFYCYGQDCDHEVFSFDELRPDFSLIHDSQEGGVLAAFNVGSSLSTPTNIKVNKFDSDFNLEWEVEIGDDRSQLISSITQDSQNNYYILGTDKQFVDNHIMLIKIDPQGNLIFNEVLDNSQLQAFGITSTDYSIGEDILFDNGCLMVLGSISDISSNPDGTSGDAYKQLLVKFDLDGNVIGAKSFIIDITGWDSNWFFDITDYGNQFPKRIIKVADQYWITGMVEVSRELLSGPTGCFISAYDENFNLLSHSQVGVVGQCYELNHGIDLAFHPNGFLYLLAKGGGYCLDVSGRNYLVKLTLSGEVVWTKNIQADNTSMHILADENIILTTPSSMSKYTQEGEKCWRKDFPGNFNTGTKHRLIETESNDLIAIGDNNTSIQIYKTDSLGNHCTNLIRGLVYFDENQNCIKDEFESGIPSLMLSESRNMSPLNFNGPRTNNEGEFCQLIDTSLVNLFVEFPNEFFEVGCGLTDSIGMKFDDYQNKSDLIEIPFWTDADCSNIRVRNQSPYNRICIEGENRINLENNSAFVENDVELRLFFPDEIEFISSPTPHTANGNTVSFNLSEVRYGFGTSILFNTLISCDAEIGDIATVIYEIMPNNPCDLDIPIIEGELHYLFGNSFDPNDITGKVDGRDTCYDSTINTELVEYLIRFENMGNDYAYEVVIRDTLDTAKLDISSLSMKEASAVYDFTIEDDTILVVTFSDINLGYEGLTNYPNVARGFVKFEVESFIDDLNSVENRAGIYFDNNEVILTNTSVIGGCNDFDGDGFSLDDDCDDTNADIYPGSVEICDNIDNDCSGEIDDNLTIYTLYQDLDEDGFGNENVSIADCDPSFIGYVDNSEDCDDTDASINPSAVEIVNNGVDEDCDGTDLTTSTQSLSEAGIEIYPNPVNDKLNIILSRSFSFSVKIISMQGQLISESNNVKQLNVQPLLAGIYFIQFEDLETGIRYVEKISKI